jgi:hypothetical protein
MPEKQKPAKPELVSLNALVHHEIKALLDTAKQATGVPIARLVSDAVRSKYGEKYGPKSAKQAA